MNWTKCGQPADVNEWITPPACQGQIVLRQYAGGEGTIFRRVWDQHSNEKSYFCRNMQDGELFEPWQQEPE